MNLYDLITLIIIVIGTSRTNEIQYMKYTSEYILKLQIHQHPKHNSRVHSRDRIPLLGRMKVCLRIVVIYKRLEHVAQYCFPNSSGDSLYFRGYLG